MPPAGKVYFPEDGTVYFRPDPSRYGRVKPRPSRLVGEFDALAALAREAPDLAVTGWTVGLHNTPLGQAHPDLVVRNAFGDPLWNSLCPAQPEVRTYLVALCADLAHNQPLAEISVETPGWQAYRHGHHHEFELVELTPDAQVLLGLCFCAACRDGARAAGIDAEALAGRAQTALEAFLDDGCDTGDVRADAEWQAFLDWRSAVVTSLVAEVKAALPPAIRLAVIPTVQSPNSLCWIEGSDLPGLAAAADRLEIPAYRTGVAAIAAEIAEVRQAAGAAARLGFILRPSFPDLRDAAEVAGAVEAAKAIHPESIFFYNYGHMRLQSLDWIAAAA